MPRHRLAFVTADRIFQSSDLNKDRSIIDVAKGGAARLRDKDGVGLVMLPEATLAEMEQDLDYAERLAQVSAQLLAVNLMTRGLGDDEHLEPLALGAWGWLSAFDCDDVEEFIGEVGRCVIEQNLPALDEALDAWEESARALRDPERLVAAAERFNIEDYVDLERPEAEVPSAAGA